MPFEPRDKLRPYRTPESELCACGPPRDWKLMFALGENPIHCARCNLEICPEELQLAGTVFESVAKWRDLWGSIYKLWLDSGPYDEWATSELTNPDSPANLQGIRLTEELSRTNACYFQCFEDQSAQEWLPRKTCPSCSNPLVDYKPGEFAHRVCSDCRLAFWR